MADETRINARLRKIEKSVEGIRSMMEDFIESAKIPDRIIGTTEAAEYLGISPSKVCEEIRAGNLPAEKGPRSYKISLRTVMERVGITDIRAFHKKS